MAKRSSFLSFFTFRALNHHTSAILAAILKLLKFWLPFCSSWQVDSQDIKTSRDRENGGAVLNRRVMHVD